MKKNDRYMNDELLVKYLLGEATTEEQAGIQSWIAESGDNKKHFEHFELIWNESKKLAAQSTVSEDEAWARFKLRTQQPKIDTAPKIIEMPAPSRNNWMRAAATLVMLIGAGGLIWYFTMQRGPEMIALRSEGSTITGTLPDGSVVTLNKSSVLTYPESFDGDMRKVTLEGEAFFDVTPDKSKPFTIHTGDVDVKVVGTSFNIKSTDAQTEVIVETGIVEVAKKEFVVKLNPHEKATAFRDRDAPVKQENNDDLYNYYRTKEFVCNGTPLWRLADVLSEAYGVEIEVAPRLRNQPLSTTFSNQSLDSILAIISETFNVQVQRNGSNILLK